MNLSTIFNCFNEKSHAALNAGIDFIAKDELGALLLFNAKITNVCKKRASVTLFTVFFNIIIERFEKPLTLLSTIFI